MTQDPSPPDPRKKWFEKLADRSTGLPQDSKPQGDPKKTDPSESSNLWRLAGLGLQFGATIALMAWLGTWIDARMKWTSSPALITLTLLAVIGNLWLLIKESQRNNK